MKNFFFQALSVFSFHLGLVFCFLFLWSCNTKVQWKDKIDSAKSEPQVPQKSQSVVSEVNPFNHEIGGLHILLYQSTDNQMPEKFYLKLDPKKLSDPVDLNIQVIKSQEPRPSWATKKEYYQTLSSKVLELPFYQKDLIRLQIFCYKQEIRYPCGHHQIQVPSVLVFRETFVLQEDFTRQFDQIWFLSGSRIVTNGHSLKMKAKLIMSLAGAQIKTLEDSKLVASKDEAQVLKPIIIEGDRAIGVLHLINRGQKGVSGKQIDRGSKIIGSYKLVSGEGLCEEGFIKKNSVKGNNGFRGGSTAPLDVTIKDVFEFRLIYELLPGEGGDPGKTLSCETPGGRGASGDIMVSCIRLGNQQLGRCEIY
jgi:hypothetical protein